MHLQTSKGGQMTTTIKPLRCVVGKSNNIIVNMSHICAYSICTLLLKLNVTLTCISHLQVMGKIQDEHNKHLAHLQSTCADEYHLAFEQ